MTLPADIMLPNDKERRQIFYWLKQISSWTAWNRILGYYEAWAAATEASVKEASKKGWDKQTGIPESDYRLILKCLAHCEEGVRRLRTGDKRVFKYDANGEFVMASRMSSYWLQCSWRLETGDSVINYDRTPKWNEFKQALTDLTSAWSECSPDIIERRDPTEPAPNVYGVWFQENLPKMHFPDTLPEVPDPIENVLVRTGKIVPCSGIWEPVEVPKPGGFSLFKSVPPPRGTLPMIGCMNYLHGGSPAPKASLETEDANPEVDATWRLLWRDERYIDGTIPAEEAGYVFRMPEPPIVKPPEPVPPSTWKLVFADTGERAPEGGRWLVEHDIHASIDIQKGDLLPAYQGESVRWVLADTW